MSEQCDIKGDSSYNYTGCGKEVSPKIKKVLSAITGNFKAKFCRHI